MALYREQLEAWRKLCNTRSSMSFIESVDVALPALLDEVERLKGEIERLKNPPCVGRDVDDLYRD